MNRYSVNWSQHEHSARCAVLKGKGDFCFVKRFPFLRQWSQVLRKKKGLARDRSFFSVTEVGACEIIFDGELFRKAHDFAKELT